MHCQQVLLLVFEVLSSRSFLLRSKALVNHGLGGNASYVLLFYLLGIALSVGRDLLPDRLFVELILLLNRRYGLRDLLGASRALLDILRRRDLLTRATERDFLVNLLLVLFVCWIGVFL